MKKKLFPLLTEALLLVLVIIALPDTAAADYADGKENFFAGLYPRIFLKSVEITGIFGLQTDHLPCLLRLDIARQNIIE